MVLKRAVEADWRIRHFIFLIHGTWGKDERGWYRPSADNSNFAHKLAARFKDTALEGAIWHDIELWSGSEVFEWECGNTHEDRMRAARNLAERLGDIRLHYPKARFHLIAHSHGGNVVLAALPIYLLDIIPGIDLNRARFPMQVFTEEDRQAFFTAGNVFVETFNRYLDNAEIRADRQLCDDLVQWRDDFSASLRKFQANERLFGKETGPNGLLLRLAFILLRIHTHATEHGIASIVFLGTPFYYKAWAFSLSRRIVDAALNVVGSAVKWGAGVYILLLIVTSTVAAFGPATLNVGANPLSWNWLLQSGLAAALVWGAFRGIGLAAVYTDSNVYFDETLFVGEHCVPAYTELGERTLFKALVLHSGCLDEAFAFLSSLPLARKQLSAQIDLLLKPQAPNFIETAKEFLKGLASFVLYPVTRVKRATPAQTIRDVLGLLGNALGCVLPLLFYPFKYLLYRLIVRPVAISVATRFTQETAYGLPTDEFRDSDIHVDTELNIAQFDTRNIDVARDLLNAPALGPAQYRKFFDFLFDDSAIEPLYAKSKMGNLFEEELTLEDKRRLLAVEARVQEFFGVSSLRHSAYYNNDVVLQAVTEFLLENAEPVDN